MVETIHRIKSKVNFAIIHKGFLQDKTLSMKAKGLMAYILSLPDDWKVIMKELVNHFSDGLEAIRTTFAELEEHGYMVKETIRNPDGTFKETIYHVYEIPNSAEGNGLNSESDPRLENPRLDKPLLDNPRLDNTTLLSNKELSNDITKEKHSCASSEIQELDTKVEELYQFYRKKSGKKYRNLYPLKQKARLRLKTYTLEEMKTAISNILASPYMTGDNENHTYYATWEYCVRNDQNIDKWLNANEEVSDADSRRIIENIERLASKAAR